MQTTIGNAFIVRVLGLLCAIAAVLSAAGCQGPARDFDAALTNKTAPDFSLEDIENKTVRLSALRGKPVVLAFFGHGCPPCRAEAAHLSNLAARHSADGLVVLAVNSWDEDHATLRAWAGHQRLKHRILTYGRDVGDELYGLGGHVPALVWIDSNGVVVDTDWGAVGPETLERQAQRVLRR
jgi:peroxiredoxin